MDISNTPFENLLKQMLQRHLTIYNGKRVLKRGKFILFKQNNFNIDLHLITPKKQKIVIYSMPIPFESNFIDSNNILFDYKISSLGKNNPGLYEKLHKITPAKKTKFYNNEIIIEMDLVL